MPDLQTEMSFRLRDLNGSVATVDVYALQADTNTLAQAVASFHWIESALSDVSDGINAGGKITISFRDPYVFPVAPVKTVEQTGVFNFLIPGLPNLRRFGLAVPAWSDTTLLPSGKIDLANTGVQFLLQVIEPGGFINGVGTVTSSDFLPLGGLADAFISFRRGRVRRRHSTE